MVVTVTVFVTPGVVSISTSVNLQRYALLLVPVAQSTFPSVPGGINPSLQCRGKVVLILVPYS